MQGTTVADTVKWLPEVSDECLLLLLLEGSMEESELRPHNKCDRKDKDRS